MVAAVTTPRPRASDAPMSLRKARRSAGSWAIIAIPILLLTMFAWQVASPLLKTEIAVRDAIGFSRVSLEADPIGSRIDFAVVDRAGQETTVTGDVSIKLREPDGTVWQTTRPLNGASFASLPDGGLLSGRLGYSIVIPASDWVSGTNGEPVLPTPYTVRRSASRTVAPCAARICAWAHWGLEGQP